MIQKRQLEFKRGDLTLLSINQTNNIFNTSKYTAINFFPRTLYHSFQRVINIWFLAISLIMLIKPYTLTPFYRWIVIFPLGINILIYMFKEFLINRSRSSKDDYINNQLTRRGKYEQGILEEEVKWKDLVIGDIIYIKKGEVVPADIILLDSGYVRDREAICMIDTQYINGKSILTKKRSSYLTQLIVTRTRQKNNYGEYRKILTGKLEYEFPNDNTEQFVGFLKLKKDPKLEQLSIHNFIPKGAKIRQTSWIFGLVVYTGMDTKMMMCSKYQTSKTDYFSKISNKLTFIIVSIVIFFSLISITVLLSRADDNQFIHDYGSDAASGYKILNLFILYSQLLPTGLFFILDLIQLVGKYLVEKRFHQRYLNQFTKINDPTALADLGQANFMLIDKTGTLTTSYQLIDSILFGQQKFSVVHDQMFQGLMSKKKGIQNILYDLVDNDNEHDNDYVINFENGKIKHLDHGLIRFEYKNQITEGVIPPMKIQEPKKNQQLFNSNNRKPVRPVYVNYDIGLHEQNNQSVCDLKQEMEYELEGEFEVGPQSPMTSLHNVQDTFGLASMRRHIYQSQTRVRGVNQNSIVKNQSQNFVGLVQKYVGESPQSHYMKTSDEHHLIYDSFLKCMILCHEGRPTYQSEEIEYESFSKNEEVALQFASLCGYVLEKFNRFDSPDEYFCKIGKEVVKYKVLGLNQFTHQRNLNSIVVQAPPTSQAKCPKGRDYGCLTQLSCSGSKNGSILICKGDYEALKDILDISLKEREELGVMLTIYKKRGVRMIIYATRELSEKQTQEYSLTFNLLKSSLTNQDKLLEQLAKDYEKDLNILGIIGFKEELKQDAFDFIQSMKASNICCWMLSGDQEHSTLSCAQSLKMTESSQSKILRINESTRDEIFLEINNCLGIVQQELSNSSETNESNLSPSSRIIKSSNTIYQGESYNRMHLFTCTINGKSLDIIEHDCELLSHFRFICCICKNVVGYNLTPQQKQFICAMIKNTFPGSPIVIAVGDGFNDALMMQEANFSIEVINKETIVKEFHPQVNAGDILVTSLTQIKDLVFGEGKQQSERTSIVIFFMFYQSIFLGMTLFFFNFYQSLTSQSMHDSMTLFCINFIFMVPNALILGIFNEPSNQHINHHFPALYVDGQVRKKYFLLLFLVKCLTDGFLQSAAVFYATIYFLPGTTDRITSKILPDIMVSSTVIIYSLLIVCTFKLFFIMIFNKVISVIFSQIVTLILIIVFILVNYIGNFSNWDYQHLTCEVFTRFDVIMTLIFNVIVCYFISFMINSVFRIQLLPTVYEQFEAQNYDGTGWSSIKNDEILNQTIYKALDVSSIVNRVFIGVTQISPYVQELLNPGDTQVTEMKLNPRNIEMKELILEKKFKSAKLKSSIGYFRFFFIAMFIYLSIYTLTDYLVGKQTQFTGLEYFFLLMIMLGLVLFTFTNYFYTRYYSLSHILVGIIVALKIVLDWLSNDFGIALSAQLLVIVGTINKTNMMVPPILFYMTTYFVLFTARIIIIGNQSFVLKTTQNLSIPEEILIYEAEIFEIHRTLIYSISTVVILSFCIVMLLLYSYYNGIKQRRNDFIARDQIKQDNSQAHDILSILVPKFVQQSISSGVYSMQEAQDDVSILFLYICDFDSIMKEEGKNVVLMLDSLFRVYDNLCLQHGVQKIETVGYTYMAASGIQACEAGISAHILREEKTIRLVNLAHDMNKQVLGRKYGQGSQIEIKVGIHVGRVIAGVIGHHKPQFSLIGDPINQTSRVGSTGDPGSITLSSQAFNKAKRKIKYYTKCQKEAKGLGIIDVYKVFQEKPANYQPSIVQQRFQAAYKMVRAEIKQKKKQNITPVKTTFFKNLKTMNMNVSFQEDNVLDNITATRLLKINSHPLTDQNIKSSNNLIQQVHEIENLISDDDLLFNQEDAYLLEHKKDIIRPNKFLLNIDEEQKDLYKNFINITKEKNLVKGRYLLAALWFTYLVMTLLLIITRKLVTQGQLIFVLRGIFVGVSLFTFPLFESAFKLRLVRSIVWSILIYGCVTTLVQTYLTSNQDLATISILELLFIILISTNLGLFNFIENILFLLCVFAVFLGAYISSNLISHQYVFYIFGAMILILINTHQNLRENIEIFNNLQINEEKKGKQLALVSQLLPTHAYLKLRNSSLYNKWELIDEFHDVTLLFADIKGFTEYSNSQTPEGVVNMLRNLFTEFDKKCQYFNVYKVYTIGDCYVVMGFTNSAKRNPIQEAINTVNIGFAMIEIIQDVRKKINFEKLDMRIGIHTGYVIGGIIGTDIVRYDIYGNDVSIANKMESNGVEGRIMVSETTKSMIDRAEKNPFIFEKIKEVDLPKFGVSYNGYLVSPQTNQILIDQEDPVSIRKIQLF